MHCQEQAEEKSKISTGKKEESHIGMSARKTKKMDDFQIGHYGMFAFDSRKANLCAGPLDQLTHFTDPSMEDPLTHFTDPSMEDPLAALDSDSDDAFFFKHHAKSFDDIYCAIVPFLPPIVYENQNHSSSAKSDDVVKSVLQHAGSDLVNEKVAKKVVRRRAVDNKGPPLKKGRYYEMESLQLHNNQNPNKIWFSVKWLENKKPTLVRKKQLVADGVDVRLLENVEKRGVKGKPKMLVGRSPGDESPIDFTQVKVSFQCKDSRCVPYALCNLLGANKRAKKRLIKANGTLCSLSDLCNHAGRVFGKTLKSIKGSSLPWLVEQSTGLFIVVCDLHCVGVDCDRQLIFDCGLPFALPLSLASLTHCGIVKISEMRQILN
jgi:hypothetical protein